MQEQEARLVPATRPSETPKSTSIPRMESSGTAVGSCIRAWLE